MGIEIEKQSPELLEKDFIHEEYRQNPAPFWLWLAIVVGITILFTAGFAVYSRQLAKQFSKSPFLRVTNREISLFLWQDPTLMRAHAKNKNGYLPAFEYLDRVGLKGEYADDYVIAPPELLFLYHNWHRLLSNELPLRKIPIEEFRLFLRETEEWQPQNWAMAPTGYLQLINDLPNLKIQNLNDLPMNLLPIIVRHAFIGWKNYFFEGNQINQLRPSFKEIEKFLQFYPHYQHNYWRNIFGEFYLKIMTEKNFNPEAIIPEEQLSSLLRVAFYNYIKQNEE